MGLFLDTAYFPGSSAAINAARSVGADGWAGYIFDPYLPNGNGGWTQQAVQELLANGLGFLPIYVPGNSPLTAQRCIEVLQSYGFNDGPCVIDIESGSDPGQAYVEQWCDVLKNAGYLPIVYGTESTVAQDANHASGIWIANYLYRSIQSNLGPFPPGFNTQWFANTRAWQYANSFDVAGVNVDASTSNLPLDYSAGKGGNPVPLTPLPATPFWVKTNNGHWFDGPNGTQQGAFTAGQVWEVIETTHDPNNGWDWYRPQVGNNNSWWFVGRTASGDADASIVPNPNPPPSTNPVPDVQGLVDAVNALKASVDMLASKLDALQHGVDAANAVLVRMENGFKSA